MQVEWLAGMVGASAVRSSAVAADSGLWVVRANDVPIVQRNVRE